MTPMFIQEPFLEPDTEPSDAYYIAVNAQYDFLPKDIEEKEWSLRRYCKSAERCCKKGCEKMDSFF